MATTAARLRAGLDARDAHDIAPFDSDANVAKKARLQQFWSLHSERFEAWAEANAATPAAMRERHARDRAAASLFSNDDAAMQALGGRQHLRDARHVNEHIDACHSVIMPELTLEWLCAPHVAADAPPPPPRKGIDDPGASDEGWPPPARGFRSLFASRCTSSTAEDDLADVAAIKRTRRSMRSAAHRHRSGGVLAAFPGLSDRQKESGLCGLGNGFSIGWGCEPLARGAEISADGADHLWQAEREGKLALLDDFRWAMHRQEGTYTFLLACADQFLKLDPAVVARLRLSPPLGSPVTATHNQPTAESLADHVLLEATRAMDLLALREALEAHANSGSAPVVAAARAARDGAAKKAKKARATVRRKVETAQCA